MARRNPGDPVPVLVPLAGWNPVDQDFPTWLAKRLTLEHPELDGPAPPEADAVNQVWALWKQRLLLPILDGLDELPEEAWSWAITHLNKELAHRQLILASREAAYKKTVAPTDPMAGQPEPLWGAAAISLQPLAPDQVRAYLRRAAFGSRAAARWKPVLDALEEDSEAPVAQALTTPLLVGMARAIYNQHPEENTGVVPDPAELCNTTQFPTSTAIHEHLFDSFIPAAYRAAGSYGWTAQKAERWLVFLARHMEHDRNGTTDLAWWELYRTLFPRMFRLLFGLIAGLLVGLAAGLVMGLLLGLANGLAAGVFCGLMGVLIGNDPPVSSPARGMRWKLPDRIAGLPGPVFGLVLGLVLVLVFGFGLAGGLVVGLIYGLIGELLFLTSGLSNVPAVLTVAASPKAVLARDRTTYWTIGLAAGLLTVLAAGLLVGLSSGLGYGLGGGLVSGLVFGLLAGFAAPIRSTAFIPFVLTRGWQALRHHLPWRLMSFLADAHQKRGVLRQAGAVYQFRHIDLQHRLARRLDR